MATETIDLTPTWGEMGNLYARLAESGERDAAKALRSEVARAFAAAQALKAITASLTNDQKSIVAKTLTDELSKQGY